MLGGLWIIRIDIIKKLLNVCNIKIYITIQIRLDSPSRHA
jgi:hypothetical protein